jgi:3-hydroxyacyl-[acyl-carrier-protein] dehydratase
MRFLLLDRIESLIPLESASAIKCWSLDNEIFKDHFPGFPVVPGVLLTESMAQLSGILIMKSYSERYKTEKKIFPVLSIIHKAKFRALVQPGDQCLIEAKLLTMDNLRANVEVQTLLKGELVCEAKLSFVIDAGDNIQHNPYLDQLYEYHYMILSKKH